ncbi:uncharacterized protein LOC135848858 [Planococcus citri]|uniref:uncharacterized protein LOC135848857 n=1 Tax=Planococcus citri TaxID=170843 RepID=UPI0031F73A17
MYELQVVVLCFLVTCSEYQVTGKSSPSSSKGKGSSGGGGGRSYTTSYYYYSYYYYRSDEDDDGPLRPQLPPATEQDKIDAANIVNANFDEKTIALILPYREQANRTVINNEIANYNHGKRLIHEKYKPWHKKNPIFKDLCFALVNSPIFVMAMYLGEFLHRKDETYIIMVLTLVQNRGEMHYIYNHTHKRSLTKRRRKQRHPFANLMKVWLDRDRDPEGSAFTPQDITKDVESMKKEYHKWKKTRDSLENTLIKKSFKFALEVINQFETDEKILIKDAIKKKIKNHDLVDAYTSLALYVKDRNEYMATILFNHCDGKDRWAVWIMMIGFINPNDWPDIDEAFKKISNGVSLKDHILKVAESDRLPFQMMAAVIDPDYKIADQ